MLKCHFFLFRTARTAHFRLALWQVPLPSQLELSAPVAWESRGKGQQRLHNCLAAEAQVTTWQVPELHPGLRELCWADCCAWRVLTAVPEGFWVLSLKGSVQVPAALTGSSSCFSLTTVTPAHKSQAPQGCLLWFLSLITSPAETQRAGKAGKSNPTK